MPTKTPLSTTLPIAFKSGERDLVKAAASLAHKPVSTYVREAALAMARAQLDDAIDQVSA